MHEPILHDNLQQIDRFFVFYEVINNIHLIYYIISPLDIKWEKNIFSRISG